MWPTANGAFLLHCLHSTEKRSYRLKAPKNEPPKPVSPTKNKNDHPVGREEHVHTQMHIHMHAQPASYN